MPPAPQTIHLRPPCLCQHLSGQTARLPDSWTHHLPQEWAINLLGFQAGTRGAGEGRPAGPLALPLGTRTASQGFLPYLSSLRGVDASHGDAGHSAFPSQKPEPTWVRASTVAGCARSACASCVAPAAARFFGAAERARPRRAALRPVDARARDAVGALAV